MTIISKNALVPFSAEKMFQLVVDVERYHEFLPWCSDSKLLVTTDEYLEGQIWVSHTGFNQSFTTRNYYKTNKELSIKLIDGPFKLLEGQWQFEYLDTNCSKISLHLEFEFKSKLITMALGPVFSQIANSMLDSFSQRAVAVYPEAS